MPWCRNGFVDVGRGWVGRRGTGREGPRDKIHNLVSENTRRDCMINHQNWNHARAKQQRLVVVEIFFGGYNISGVKSDESG